MVDMPKKLLIFDWDGTLADSIYPIVCTMQFAFQHCGFPIPNEASIRHLIGRSLPDVIDALAPQLSVEQRQNIAQSYTHSALNPNNHQMKLFDDVLPCLQTLKAQGYWLAVATGKSRTGLNQSIQQTQTSGFWLSTRCASECPPKPAPDMVWEICDELGVSPRDAIVIGDTTYDLEMAKHAGSQAIAVCTGAHSQAVLQTQPQLAILNRLGELPALLENHLINP